ncbi:MFS general substrate transporter [Phanerochaete sordida]|uniref:MFS general substrate transporter n=1 Tax=Phanerochaete sordida TaxID=48140 RepID=A0A9P3GPS6_9APHY|nr:MFS general substrate transporter [Phanerochaete sordida]
MPSSIELQTIASEPATPAAESIQESAENAHLNESSLAPVDRGFGAWSFLAGAFLIEGLVWGFPNAYGVFLVKYLEDPAWASQKHARGLLPLIGPMASGIMYGAASVSFPMAARFPRHRRKAMWLGVVLIFVSLFAASFARTIPSLLALQGVMYAIGGALLYAPAIYYMSDWFVERRGLALGIIDAGTACGGLVLPLILPPLVDKHGSAKILRYYSIVCLGLLTLILPFVRGRLPEARMVHGPVNPRAFAVTQNRLFWLKDKTFWVINVANTLQGLAYFVPLLWLPTYASSLRLSSRDSSLSLALLNAASLVGRMGSGMLSDTVNPWLIASTTLMLTSLSIFILWGVLSYTFAGVLVYGIAYGCLAGGWTSLWASFLRPIAKDDPTHTTSMLGVLMLFRGIGNILSTPISTALQGDQSGLGDERIGVAGAYQGAYEKVIIYAGTCFAAAALVVAAGWAVNGPLSPRRR